MEFKNPRNLSYAATRQEEIARLGKTIPEFRPGDTVIVQVKVRKVTVSVCRLTKAS